MRDGMRDGSRASLDRFSLEGSRAGDRVAEDEQMGRIAFAMHELCQPLMALQCRLEIGRMIGTAEGYAEAVRESLAECDRLLVSVEVLRGEVLRGLHGSDT